MMRLARSSIPTDRLTPRGLPLASTLAFENRPPPPRPPKAKPGKQPTQVGGLPGFAFGGRGGGGRFSNANVDASGNPRGVSLSVGIDDRANRIIVNCTESLYQDIQKLVDQLDSG